MKRILPFIIFLMVNLLSAQNTGSEVTQIKQQMAKIRQSTNWNDPASAKIANAKIDSLATKLIQAIRNNRPPQQQQSTGKEQIDQESATEIQQKIDDFSNKLMKEMMKIVREGGTWDLAKPLREEIVDEYKEDENPAVKNPEWLKSMTYLLINLSLPQVQVIIDQMPMYKGIKTLIITTEKPVVNPNLLQILNNAMGYTLEELYIINFGPSLTSLPSSIGDFPKLKKLVVYNNGLSSLPASVTKLTNLTSLQIQDNPINTLMPSVIILKNLEELGINLTKLSDNEINLIQRTLPECKITRQ
jgi:hypothetical protein